MTKIVYLYMCNQPSFFRDRSRTIMASEFQVDNKQNIEAVKRMGITVLKLSDGRIKLIRNASMVMTFLYTYYYVCLWSYLCYLFLSVMLRLSNLQFIMKMHMENCWSLFEFCLFVHLWLNFSYSYNTAIFITLNFYFKEMRRQSSTNFSYFKYIVYFYN